VSNLFSALKISGSGMTVQRLKMNTASENIANAETTKTPEGIPYRRKRVSISSDDRSENFAGEFRRARVQLTRTNSRHKALSPKFHADDVTVADARARVFEERGRNFRMIYDPSHPDADPDGYVAMPNINIVTEMVDMMVAARAFEANVTSATATKEMISEAMDI
jgi:flagellar basal-body rod protein FlgC